MTASLPLPCSKRHTHIFWKMIFDAAVARTGQTIYYVEKMTTTKIKITSKIEIEIQPAKKQRNYTKAIFLMRIHMTGASVLEYTIPINVIFIRWCCLYHIQVHRGPVSNSIRC